MAEYRLFHDQPPPYAYPEYFTDTPNCNHLDTTHRPRLEAAAELVSRLYRSEHVAAIVDVGAGDGGLLSLLPLPVRRIAVGYEIIKDSVRYANQHRLVDVREANVITDNIWHGLRPRLVVATEMLEHLADPHAYIRTLGQHADWLVASSPWNETPDLHYHHHVWAWDREGYAALLAQGGFEVLECHIVEYSQIVVARRVQEAAAEEAIAA